MFNNLFKAVVGAAVETPIAVVADVITLGGSLTDQEKPYTAKAFSKVVENIQESTKPNWTRKNYDIRWTFWVLS